MHLIKVISTTLLRHLRVQHYAAQGNLERDFEKMLQRDKFITERASLLVDQILTESKEEAKISAMITMISVADMAEKSWRDKYNDLARRSELREQVLQDQLSEVTQR